MSGVSIDIEESDDGTRRIIVWDHDHGDELDSDQARQLAAALLAAADELDDDANREALLAGMWPHLQAEAKSQRLADNRDADGMAEQ